MLVPIIEGCFGDLGGRRRREEEKRRRGEEEEFAFLTKANNAFLSCTSQNKLDPFAARVVVESTSVSISSITFCRS